MLSGALELASAIRVPVFPRGNAIPTRERISQLEEFMLVSAYHAGELHRERLDAYVALEPLKRQWEALEGWEMYRRSKTEAAVEDAKRQLRPELHAEIARLGWTIRRLSEEVDRLERDAQKVSRVYTMISGN